MWISKIDIKEMEAGKDLVFTAVGIAKLYKPGETIRAIDDASIVIIEIEPINKEYDERG